MERGTKRKEIKQERKTEQNRLQINLLRELFSDKKVKEFSIQIFTLKKKKSHQGSSSSRATAKCPLVTPHTQEKLGASTLQSDRSSIRYLQDEDKVFHAFKAEIKASAPLSK